jgi:hypothetical protein
MDAWSLQKPSVRKCLNEDGVFIGDTWSSWIVRSYHHNIILRVVLNLE